jgi:hypothetical protein
LRGFSISRVGRVTFLCVVTSRWTSLRLSERHAQTLRERLGQDCVTESA